MRKKGPRDHQTKRPRARSKPSTPGPKPSITLAVVKRVSRRVAMGSTLTLALAAEGHGKVNEETWKKALQSHREFSPHYEQGKGKFLAGAMERLQKSKDLKFLCWLLERRHADLFARPAAVSVAVNNTNVIELPREVIERARELSKEPTPVPSKEGK